MIPLGKQIKKLRGGEPEVSDNTKQNLSSKEDENIWEHANGGRVSGGFGCVKIN